MFDQIYTEFQEINSKDGLLLFIPKIKEKLIQFYNSIPMEDFFKSPENAWSPKKNVEHLSKAIFPVVIGMNAPRFSLLIFGKNSAKEINLNQTIENYKSKTASGSQAGIFEPIEIFINKNESEKTNIISELEKNINRFQKALAKWTDEELLEYNMPHPILGNITVLEMSYFTIFHLFHHSLKVESRFKK